MEQFEKNNRNYIGYEYKEIRTDSRNISLYLDSYECFGWNIDEATEQVTESRLSVIHLKRDRKIMNKQELTRLQRNFEDCMNQIDTLEKSKASKATMAAIIIGIIGTAFIAGSVFAVTANPPIIWLCIVLAIPGFIGWTIPIWAYKYMINKRMRIVTPLIEEKYDEIHEICEKGSRLLV